MRGGQDHPNELHHHVFWRAEVWQIIARHLHLEVRGVLETLQHLNRLTACGVGYKSYTEQYLDSCGIFKDAVIGILAVIAKQERVRLSERTRAGIAIARSKGRQLGRPRLRTQPTEIARLRSSGLSLRAIGRELGISEGSVRRLASTAA